VQHGEGSLIGREHEERVIRVLVSGAARRGGAQVVIGDPGIGKSALVGLAREIAIQQGFAVLAMTGVQAESRLPFAGLDQLLRPLHDRIGELPGPQRDAVLSAFGKTTPGVRASEAAPEGFLVGIAVTELLIGAASRQPLVVLADDAHWLDPSSCTVLAFLARRIQDARIAVIAAARDGYRLPLLEAGLPELRLDGISEAAACLLLDAVAPGLGAGARRAILDTAIGNPLALRELSRGAPHGPAASSAALGATGVTHRIEKAFAARWSELPYPTRTVLIIAALNEGGTLRETLSAARLLLDAPVSADAVTQAIDARLIDATQATLRFRHPLVRSAIEHRAGLSTVVAAHEALARVLADQPDRRAWHLAAAALGPDENVAAELDAAADRAAQRAAIGVALSALERAVELSLDPERRNTRLLRAGQLAWELGEPTMVDRYVRSVDRTGLALTDRTRLAVLQENITIGRTDGDERIEYLVKLAGETAADGQVNFALELLMSAARRSWWGAPSLRTRMLIADEAAELADSPLSPALLTILAYATPDVHGTVVRERLAVLAAEASLGPVELTHLGLAASILGAFEQSRVLLAAAIPQLRAQGRLGLLVRALHHDAGCALYTSQWPAAIAAAKECERTAADADQQQWVALSRAQSAAIAAVRGEDEEAERLASEAERVFVTGSSGAAIGRGLAALGRRDYQEAYQHLMRLYDPADGAFHYLMRMYHLGDLADAAVHSGHREQARELIAELTVSRTQEAGPLMTVSVAFAAAMLADDEEASQVFERVLTEDFRRWPFHYARLKLEYGSWLRRHRQPAQSREHLRTARDILAAIGARAWRDQADIELRASGALPRVSAAKAGRFGQLTPQEQRIARLVLAGLSNKEINAAWRPCTGRAKMHPSSSTSGDTSAAKASPLGSANASAHRRPRLLVTYPLRSVGSMRRSHPRDSCDTAGIRVVTAPAPPGSDQGRPAQITRDGGAGSAWLVVRRGGRLGSHDGSERRCPRRPARRPGR
jgi:AAA ATPase domain